MPLCVTVAGSGDAGNGFGDDNRLIDIALFCADLSGEKISTGISSAKSSRSWSSPVHTLTCFSVSQSRARSRTAVTNAPRPGSSDSRGPATFRTRIFSRLRNCFKRLTALRLSPLTICKNGLWHFRAIITVRFVPPATRRVLLNISEPSESRTFHRVRWR